MVQLVGHMQYAIQRSMEANIKKGILSALSLNTHNLPGVGELDTVILVFIVSTL